MTGANRVDGKTVCRLCDGDLRPTRLSEPIERRDGRPVLPAEHYTLGVCSRCGLAQVNFKVDQAYLNDGYASEDEAMILELTGRAPSELSAARMPEFRRVLDLIAMFIPPEPSSDDLLLDIGCQDGRLLSMAREFGFRVAGLEPSSEHAERARRELPDAHIVTGSLGSVAMECQSNVVTFLETLEHIAEPRQALVDVVALTRPGGLIVISVPSWTYFRTKSQIFQLLRRPTSQIHTHITCFSRASLRQAVAVVGGTVEHLEPTGWHGRLRFANRVVRIASRLGIPFVQNFGPSLTVVMRTPTVPTATSKHLLSWQTTGSMLAPEPRG